ncbi:amidohydrolase [Desulforhopalus singaporensis]|nr:amidohydrolase [Desulforhopalus singaporensis]
MLSRPSAADIVFFNGTVFLPGGSSATGVAVGNGTILRVGGDEEVLSLAGFETEKIDLDGRLVVPGFIDTHIHFYEWANNRSGLQLDRLASLEELLGRLKKAVARREPGTWIVGQGWNETEWDSPSTISRDDLDRIAPKNPVLLWRCDLHLAVANSMALKLAGIDGGSADPAEGRIERDTSGRPTGVLRELAINLVREVVPPPGPDEIKGAFLEAMAQLHRRGITSIHDVRLMADRDGGTALQVFRQLEEENSLDLRCWVGLPGERLDECIELGLRTGFGSDRLRLGHVKYFADGGVGARTAWMVDPYRDAECGMPLADMEVLAQEIGKADRNGLAVMVHAIGDRANREVISIFENLEDRRRLDRYGLPGVRHRIEHVQVIQPRDIARLRRLPLALNVTPANLVLDINLIEKALGERGAWAYCIRQLVDTGLPVMFSSDCPVCDPDPLAGIRAAVFRQRSDGTPAGGWYPQARVAVETALRCYSAVPADVHNAPCLGVIEPGRRADLVVLNRNILSGSLSALSEATVDITVFDGRIVFCR